MTWSKEDRVETVLDLSNHLAERELSLAIYDCADEWCVHLFPTGDPRITIIKSGTELRDVIREALDEWDGRTPENLS